MPIPIHKKVSYNAAGGPLSVNVVFDTLMVCTYQLILRENGSNATVIDITGDNANDQDDTYQLPGQARENNGRILWAYMTVIKQNEKGGNYQLGIEIYQDGQKIDSIMTKSKRITGNNVTEILIFKFSC